jgi:hypothetical protein
MDKNSKPIQYIQRSIDRDRIAILKDLDRLFKDESRWTKGYWTRNSDSKRVALNSHDVSSYCLLGGLGSLRRQYTRAVVADTFDLLRHLANRMMPNLGINIKTGNMLDGCIALLGSMMQNRRNSLTSSSWFRVQFGKRTRIFMGVMYQLLNMPSTLSMPIVKIRFWGRPNR